MKPPGWLAALVLFLHLPIPLYWFVMHPFSKFWRNRRRAAYLTGLFCSWPPVTAALVVYRRELFRARWPPMPMLVAGLMLIAFEAWIFWRVHRDLGAARLVGEKELAGSGELQNLGIYAHIRHPRYTGSFLALLGACLLAGTRAMCAVTGLWVVLMLLAISLEEHELRRRFAAAYGAYARSVPRFFPVRSRSRESR